jgi:hypothetical protein
MDYDNKDILKEQNTEYELESVSVNDVKTYIKKPYYYPSNVAGSHIKNAVTGVEYAWRVGSFDSQRLFKVVDTIGNYDCNGKKINVNSKDYPNPMANHCYYDNPQQYMTHRRTRVNPLLVSQWEAKQSEFRVLTELE